MRFSRTLMPFAGKFLAGALAPAVYLSFDDRPKSAALLKCCQKAEIEISAANDAVRRPETEAETETETRRHFTPAAPFQQVACMHLCFWAAIARPIDYSPRIGRECGWTFGLFSWFWLLLLFGFRFSPSPACQN